MMPVMSGEFQSSFGTNSTDDLLKRTRRKAKSNRRAKAKRSKAARKRNR